MNNNYNKIISTVLVLLSFFIIVLFTKDALFSLQSNLDEKNTKTKQEKEKKETFDELTRVKTELLKNSNNEIEKYLSDFSEDEIINYIYSEIEKGNLANKNGLAKIKNLTISKGQKNELGFLESNISLTLEVQNEKKMKSILDFFVSKNSKYKFFIDKFSYKKPSRKGIANLESYFDITIPLKIYYK